MRRVSQVATTARCPCRFLSCPGIILTNVLHNQPTIYPSIFMWGTGRYKGFLRIRIEQFFMLNVIVICVPLHILLLSVQIIYLLLLTQLEVELDTRDHFIHAKRRQQWSWRSDSIRTSSSLAGHIGDGDNTLCIRRVLEPTESVVQSCMTNFVIIISLTYSEEDEDGGSGKVESEKEQEGNSVWREEYYIY